MISKSFLKSSFVYTLGGSMPMLSGIILLPFYTNYLSGRDFVALGFYQGISMLCQILFSFSVDSYYGVKYTNLTEHPEQQKRFTGTVSSLLFFIGAILLLLSLLAGPYLFSAVFREDIGVYFWPFGFYSILTGFFNSYFKTYTNSIIYFKKPLLHLSLNTVNFFLTIALSLFGLYLFPNTVNGPVYGRLFSGLAIFILAGVGFYRYSAYEFDKSYLKDLVKFCIPFVLYTIANWALTYIDRYFLKSKIDAETLASYHLILTCYLGVEFIQNGLSSAIFPKLFEIWNKNKKFETTPESNRYFNVFGSINILVLISFCLIVPAVVIVFVKKPEYYDSFRFLGLISAGYATRSILNFYLSGILYSRNIWLLVRIFGCTSIVQFGATWFLVSEYGLPGAVLAGVITKVVSVLFSALLTKNNFIYKFNFLKIYGLPFIFIITNMVLYWFFNEFNLYVYITELLVFCIIIYLIFKNEIKLVLGQYVRK